MIRMVVDHPDIARRDLSSLAAIYCGAAPIAENILKDARAVWGNIKHQVYAQSEGLPLSVLSPAYHRPGEPTASGPGYVRPVGRSPITDHKPRVSRSAHLRITSCDRTSTENYILFVQAS